MFFRKYIFFIALIILFINATNAQIDTLSIRKHLNKIIKTEKPRNYRNIETLNRVANYIYRVFNKYSDTVYYQPFTVNGKTYKNVIAVFGSQNTQTIVAGAHYDVYGNQDGADDNASGVVGLLELAKLLKGEKLKYRIELVAYTLEEPPYFKTENMGSYVHAQSLHQNKVEVYGMFSLEMIGYYDDTKKSQKYPIGILSLFYGNKGDFITLVNKLHKGKFARRFSRKFKKQKLIKTKKFTAPAKLPGIDFSDHLNYWKFGFSALMITDTAFYRNQNYHEQTDTMETLDLTRMQKVIETLYKALMSM